MSTQRLSPNKKNNSISPYFFYAAFGFFLLLILPSLWSSSDTLPLDSVRLKYKSVPTYSVLLDDAKEEGNFFKSYFLKYAVVLPEGKDSEVQIQREEWQETSKDDFNSMLPFLGMTVFAKKDSTETSEAGPPGYEYVGNPQYGSWQSGSGGGSFWMWYGGYRIFSDLLGSGNISRTDYDTYHGRRSQGQPYWGPRDQYGIKGSQTKASKPSFYERHNAKKLEQRANFSNKVQSRIGRNSVAVRSRSGGKGK